MNQSLNETNMRFFQGKKREAINLNLGLKLNRF